MSRKRNIAIILGIETSCDETSLAIYSKDKGVLAHLISSQIEIHRPYGGVVPEIASRNHLLQIEHLFVKILKDSKIKISEIDGIASTIGPGLASSLLVGVSFGKALSIALGKPFFGINHMEGHLISSFFSRKREEFINFYKSVSLIISGGHTLLLDVDAIGEYKLLGKTLDDAVGEAFDKVARLMDLPYPGGPEIDKLARKGDENTYKLPKALLRKGNLNFSFSGLKTAVLYLIPKIKRDESWKSNLSASFQKSVADVLIKKSILALEKTGKNNLAISGGVSCNSYIRKRFKEMAKQNKIKLHITPKNLSTDNALMIALVGAQKFETNAFSPLEIDVDPRLGLALS